MPHVVGIHQNILIGTVSCFAKPKQISNYIGHSDNVLFRNIRTLEMMRTQLDGIILG